MGIEGKSLFSWLKKQKSKKLFCFDDGNKGESLTEKQKEIFEVTFGTRKKTELQDSKGNIIFYEKGNRRYGANHIKKHFGYRSTGALLYTELFLIEEVLQKGKIDESKTRITNCFQSVVYEYERQNRLLFVVVKKQITTGSQSVLSYFSSEYFTDHTQKIGEGSQDQPNSYSLDQLYQKNRDTTKKQERDYTAGQPNSCSNTSIVSEQIKDVNKPLSQSFFPQERYSILPLFCLSLMDTVFRSPGVHPQKIIKMGVKKEKISSSTQLFLERCPTKEIIGVTGTKGKGTSSSLITEILTNDFEESKKVFLGGNIGTPVFDFIDEITELDIVVLELSSFQLYDLSLSPKYSVLLRTESEHLDWHSDVLDYREAKKNIFLHQSDTDTLVYFDGNSSAREMVKNAVAEKISVFSQKEKNWIEVLEEKIISSLFEKNDEIDVSHIALRGEFHRENVLAAIAISKKFDVANNTIRKTLQSFIGLPMRCQLVSTAHDRFFYNDSFSTIPETTVSALSTFTTPVAVIVGGSEKHSDFTEMAGYMAKHVCLTKVYVIGVTAERIIDSLKKACTDTNTSFVIHHMESLESIVPHFMQHSKKGESLLLSPACASFGMFPNYKKRGEVFDELVTNFCTVSIGDLK